MKHMSVEDFLARQTKPKAKKTRRKQRDLQTQYADSKRRRCPPGCAEGDRLYRELGVILRMLVEHRETH